MAAETQITAARLAQDIRQVAAAATAPFVVAIDGRSGTGKSTLARALAVDLPVTLIEGDDFYAGGVMLRSDPPEVLADNCMDWQRLSRTLAALVTTGEASFHPFDWAGFDGALAATPKHLTAKPVVILDGAYTARPDLRPQIDMCILAVTDEAVRLARLEQREGPLTDWERQWHRAEDYYFDKIVQPTGFDKIIRL